MGVQEFENTIKYIKSLISKESIHCLGFSKANIGKATIFEILLLLLFFLFMFLGIGAFSNGSTFGSVINSFIPIAGGGIITISKDIDIDKIL